MFFRCQQPAELGHGHVACGIPYLPLVPITWLNCDAILALAWLAPDKCIALSCTNYQVAMAEDNIGISGMNQAGCVFFAALMELIWQGQAICSECGRLHRCLCHFCSFLTTKQLFRDSRQSIHWWPNDTNPVVSEHASLTESEILFASWTQNSKFQQWSEQQPWTHNKIKHDNADNRQGERMTGNISSHGYHNTMTKWNLFTWAPTGDDPIRLHMMHMDIIIHTEIFQSPNRESKHQLSGDNTM